jgi:uncharacterized protein (DUF362 family)
MDKATVSVDRCYFDAEDNVIEEEVSKLIDMIGGLPDQIQEAQRILIKPNVGFPDVRRHKGRLVALSEPCVTRAVLKRIREVNEKAQIMISDAPPKGLLRLAEQLGYSEISKEFDAKVIDCNSPPYVDVEVPGKPLILRKYTLNKDVASTDATVSIAKMKVHVYAGVSLCIKNLFGFPPDPIYGTPGLGRTYLHYPFRLPRCIVDLTAIFNPSLCIIEGLVGEELKEWKGPAVESNLLVVGNNAVATDAIGTLAMGFNPEADFPETPFLYEISHIKLAESIGLGPCNPSKIKLVGENPEKVKVNFRKIYAFNQPPQLHLETRKYIAQQASRYIELLPKLFNHAGKYVLIEDGEIKNVSSDLEYFSRFFWEKYNTYVMKRTGSEYKKDEFLKLPFIKKIEHPDKDPEIMEAFAKI